ncbi:MAG TPA: methionyl-tRNA formyltransferase [Dehalococcoidia bacterium]|nr:methionyl-tRNA formyltransferase [Dehalococcoidia bacterium]
MSIVFLGTAKFAVPSLQVLVKAGYDVSAVVTQPDRPAGRGRRLAGSPVKAAAQELGLPVLQFERLHTPGALSQLQELGPEAMVACAFGQILRPQVLGLPPRGILNIHPSLLPRHRGATPIPSAILAGDSETGVTIILMDAGLDSGPILSQTRLPIDERDTTGSLSEKLAPLAAQLLVPALGHWLAGEIEPQPQDESVATVTHHLQKEDGRIDWSRPAIEIWRQVRAFNPRPGAYTLLDSELLHIWQAWLLPQDSGRPPGTALALSVGQQTETLQHGLEAGFAVQTGSGALAVCEVQRAGRRALTATEFLRGTRGLIGKQLG